MTTTAEVFTAALRGEPCTVSGSDGEAWELPVFRWSGEATTSDLRVLGHVEGRALDVGCGPGRLTHALTSRGTSCLGIDVVHEAVEQTRARGSTAIRRDVFGRVPGEGRWDTVLLADGNIGIGGDPVNLLRRVGDLLRAGGRVVVDLAPPGAGLTTRTLSLHASVGTSEPFAWSVVGPEALTALAEQAGLEVALVHQDRGRWYAVMRKGDPAWQ